MGGKLANVAGGKLGKTGVSIRRPVRLNTHFLTAIQHLKLQAGNWVKVPSRRRGECPCVFSGEGVGKASSVTFAHHDGNKLHILHTHRSSLIRASGSSAVWLRYLLLVLTDPYLALTMTEALGDGMHVM